MYSKLYFIIYSFLKSKKNHDPEFNSSLLVFTSQSMHFLLFAAGFKYFMDLEIPKFSSDSGANKLAVFPIGIIWLITVHYYFKNRIDKMSKRFKKITLTNTQFTILIILVIILPLYGVIKLSGGEVWK